MRRIPFFWIITAIVLGIMVGVIVAASALSPKPNQGQMVCSTTTCYPVMKK